MLSDIYTKIRALCQDVSNTSFEVFEYTTSNIFTIAQTNIVSIDKVLRNGAELGSGEYDFDTVTNKITITLSSGSEFATGDQIEIDYTYTNYSESELKEFVRASLVWMSIFSSEEYDYEIQDSDIYPTMDNRTEDLTSIIASILIKPNYNVKTLSGITVKYPKTMTKEEVIEKLITRFNRGIGIVDTITIT